MDADSGFTLVADCIEGVRDDLFAMEDDVAKGMRESWRSYFRSTAMVSTSD